MLWLDGRLHGIAALRLRWSLQIKTFILLSQRLAAGFHAKQSLAGAA